MRGEVTSSVNKQQPDTKLYTFIMIQILRLTATLICLVTFATCDPFVELYHWKQLMHLKDLMADSTSDIIFTNNPPANQTNESFVSYNNIPTGITHHKGRLFMAVPRRQPGVPGTMNVIDMNVTPKDENSPALQAYPDYLVNQLHNDYHADPKRIVSVYRSQADVCDRLWFVDTGMLEYPNNQLQVQRPQLWIIDLTHNRKVRTFEIPESIVEQGVGMASLAVDVDSGSCDKAFAYIPDLAQAALYVYSFEKNEMWRFNHSSFRHDPNRASFNVAGQRFEWDDGIFSITVGKRDPSRQSKTIYYHPMVSTSEFITFSDVLQNGTLAKAGGYETFFIMLGERGPNTQCTMHYYDPGTEVIFYGEINRNSIGCWNTRNNFTAENHDIIQLDHQKLIYPTDLNADVDGTIWVLSNNLPTWIYSRLDENRFNFYVWYQTPQKAIDGTKCAN